LIVLRHTAATWAVEGGIDVDKVADMTGHADRRTLEGIYVHKSGQSSRTAVEAVEKKLGGRLRVVK
jgi:integrase